MENGIMKLDPKSSGSKLNRTADLVKFVRNSESKANPTDALKPIKGILKTMGFTMGKMDRKTLAFPVDYNPAPVLGGGIGAKSSTYKAATMVDMLRSYMKSIKGLNVKNHKLGGKNCPISHMKKAYSKELATKDVEEILIELDPKNDMPTIRLALKKLRHEFKGHAVISEAIKRVHIENQAYYWLMACQYRVSNIVREESSKSFSEKRNDTLLINPEFVLDWSKSVLVDNKNKTKNTSDKEIKTEVARLTLALMVATGRRTSEILKTAIFTKMNSEREVMFDGQLKLKDREALSAAGNEYPIPLLFDADLVISALNRLRRFSSDIVIGYMKDDGTDVFSKLNDKKLRMDIRHTEGVNDCMSDIINMECKRLFNSADVRPYFLRAAYTSIAFERGLNKKGEGEFAFRKRVLGHSDYKSSANYDRFKLSTGIKSIQQENIGATNEKSASETLDFLSGFDDEIKSNTRAKGMHKLHDHAMNLAKNNGIELAQINATWARKQIINGKTIGAASVKSWLAVLGL